MNSGGSYGSNCNDATDDCGSNWIVIVAVLSFCGIFVLVYAYHTCMKRIRALRENISSKQKKKLKEKKKKEKENKTKEKEKKTNNN